MTGSKLLFAVHVLCSCIIGVLNKLPEYEIASLCNRSQKVHSSVMVKAGGMLLTSVCTFTIYSELHTTANNTRNNRLRMELLSLQMPCGISSLQLFDGGEHVSTGTILSGRLCGSVSSQQTTMYISAMNECITVDIQSSNNNTPVSFQLLATATSIFPESDDFVCNNHFAVDQSLKCDGYNNCGDWSDENDDLCDAMYRSLMIGLLGGGAVAIVIIFAVFVFLVYRHRNRCRQQGYKPETSRETSPFHHQAIQKYGSVKMDNKHSTQVFSPAPVDVEL